jgi:hypothetical protein
MRLQKDVVDSVLSSEDLQIPSLLQSTLICNFLREEDDNIVMERTEPRARDSGWFCGCRGKDHDHNDANELRCVSLYEAVVRHSQLIVPYLALPAGTFVAISNGRPTIFLNGEPAEFKNGSFLAAKFPNS